MALGRRVDNLILASGIRRLRSELLLAPHIAVERRHQHAGCAARSATRRAGPSPWRIDLDDNLNVAIGQRGLLAEGKTWLPSETWKLTSMAPIFLVRDSLAIARGDLEACQRRLRLAVISCPVIVGMAISVCRWHLTHVQVYNCL